MSSHQHAGACPNCGHAPPHRRLTVRSLAHTVGEHLSLERGLLMTLRDLVLRPGRVIGVFIAGERGRYVSPITAFFFAAAVSLLVFHMFEDSLLAFTRADMGQRLANVPADARARAFRFLDAMMKVSNKPALVGFVTCFPQAIAMRLLFRGARWNVAEALVYALYTRATTFVVYSLLVVPWMGLAHQWNQSIWTTVALTAAIAVHAACDLFGWRLGVAVRALAAAAVAWCAGIAFSIVAAIGLMLARAA